MAKVFLAGIIQGSIAEAEIHRQDYRDEVIAALRMAAPDLDIYDPISLHPNSLDYPTGKSRDVFFELMQRAGEVDVLIAFLPEASMGTAIEIWRAWHSGALVIAVSPMIHNWVVRFITHKIYTSLEELEAAATGGELSELIESHLTARAKAGDAD